MTIHKLKLSPIYYDDSASGIKTFEIRKNDRDFKVGDILELREYAWSNLEKRGAYTGAVHWKVITYILDDEEYLHDSYVCLAVSPIAEPENEPLTLEELRQMDGEPVYVVTLDNPLENQPYWAIAGINSNDSRYQNGVALYNRVQGDWGAFDLYGDTWLAYRRKPERSEG